MKTRFHTGIDLAALVRGAPFCLAMLREWDPSTRQQSDARIAQRARAMILGGHTVWKNPECSRFNPATGRCLGHPIVSEGYAHG